MNLIEKLKSYFRDMLKDRQTEREVRQWLNRNKYNGKSAEFHSIELYAIERPGWKQIFRFSGNAVDPTGARVAMFGVMSDDDRKGKPKIMIFDNLKDQLECLRAVSVNCIIRGQR